MPRWVAFLIPLASLYYGSISFPAGVEVDAAAPPVPALGLDSVTASDDGRVPAAVLAQRRAALLELLEPGLALVRSADPRAEREHPQDSDFRQDNDFYYLTGLETPGSWLALLKGEDGAGEVVLYLPDRNPQQEIWTGPQLGPGARTAELTGVARTVSLSQFEPDLLTHLRQPPEVAGYPRIYLSLDDGAEGTREVLESAVRTGQLVSDLRGALARLRLVKDSVELARIRSAVEITVEAQRRAMSAARPGIHEYELEAIVEYVFRANGAERVAFPTIVGSGPNSVTLHYDSNRRQTTDSDLVVIDAGAEYRYYAADVTRTFPVNGKFSKRQRAIYELVLGTQLAAIDSVRPGVTVWQLEGIARRYMREHSGSLCGERTCDRYFRHGLAHWLGMDVHDVGSYTTPLAPGMVLTIEPGIYLADEGLGVRIEDDVLVTTDGAEVLSAGAPKTVEEIETVMAEAASTCECDPPR